MNIIKWACSRVGVRRLEFGSALDTGKTRQHKKNQDNLAILHRASSRPMVIIADGMGGYEGGALASQLVIKAFKRGYKPLGSTYLADPDLKNIVRDAHTQIIQKSRKNPEFSRMGSTVVAVSIDLDSNQLTVINVGDSRAYLFTKQSITQISYDHSEVAELVRNNAITPEEALTYSRKNVLSMSISAAREEGKLTPYLQTVDFPPESVLLLCSDGLWGPVSENLIQMIALEYPPEEAAKRLAETANMNGGPDNISVVIVRRKGEWQNYRAHNSINFDETKP